MPSNALPKHRRARHGDPRLGLDVSLAEQERMVELYRRGWTLRRIGEELHWSASTVSRVLILWGENRPDRRRFGHPPKLSADEVLRTAQLYGMGYNMREVGAMLGITPSAVQRRLERAGTKARNGGRAATASRMKRKAAA
jgi:predicted transcriptional regulator